MLSSKELARRAREDALAAELVRAVRRLHLSRKRTVGLLPLSPSLPLDQLLLRLAAALAEGFAGRVDVLTSRELGPPAMLPGGTMLRGTPDDAARRRPATWLVEELSRVPEDVGAVLVDMSGLVARGEHTEVIAALDGVAALGQSGVVTEGDLAWLRREVPESRLLGVLLVDAPS